MTHGADPHGTDRSEPVIVSRRILDGIEAVRASGRTNMLDRPAVMRIADQLGFRVASLWVYENPSKYARGIFAGFRVDPDATPTSATTTPTSAPSAPNVPTPEPPMPELHETRVGRAFFERDVPAIARQLARIADALERIASAGDQPGTDARPSTDAPASSPTTTTAPAGDTEPRGADADDPEPQGA